MKKYSTNYAIKMLGFTVIAFVAMLKPAFSQEPAIDNDLITYPLAVSSNQQVKFRVPLDIRSGDMITGTVVEEKKSNAGEVNKASSTLEGIVIEIDGKQTKISDRVISFLVPAGLTSLPFLLKNSAGQVIEQGQIPIDVYSRLSSWLREPVEMIGAKFSPQAVGQPGQPLKVTGSFDGNAANTTISLNGQASEIIAESPRGSYIQVPQNANAGNTNITISENNVKEEHRINVAVLNLSADKTTLRRGQKATITVTVSGLQSLKEGYDCRVDISNLSPQIVSFKNKTGNNISQTIPSGLNGDYTFSFSIVGVTQGDYALEGLLLCTQNSIQEYQEYWDWNPYISEFDSRTFKGLLKKISTRDMENILRDLNWRKDNDYSQNGGNPGPDAAWLWERIRMIMDELEYRGYTFNNDGTLTRPSGARRIVRFF